MAIQAIEIEAGILAAQSVNINGSFQRLRASLEAEGSLPRTIVEIGTAEGGLTLFLRKTFPEAEIHSYDCACKLSARAHELFAERAIVFHQIDCFGSDGSAQIRAYVQQPGQSIVLCDGGNKRAEFSTFASCLKPKDIIMAHDYCSDRETWAREFQDIWHWLEITDADVEAACKDNSLGPYLQDEFRKAVWKICRK